MTPMWRVLFAAGFRFRLPCALGGEHEWMDEWANRLMCSRCLEVVVADAYHELITELER